MQYACRLAPTPGQPKSAGVAGRGGNGKMRKNKKKREKKALPRSLN